MSFPFFGEVFTFTQPDGTHLQVRGWGDQNRAVFETLDGFTVVRDPVSGFFNYANLTPEGDELRASGVRPGHAAPQAMNLVPSIRVNRAGARAVAQLGSGLPKPRWQERHEQAKTALRATALGRAAVQPAPPARQTVGDYVGLCLLVQFPDVPATISQADVDAFCNQPGYTGFGNHGSVYDYFLDNSNGKLRYKTVVAPYYTAQHPRDYYTNPSVPYGARARDLIKEALSYHRNHDFNFSTLTVDDQDDVFATNVFYSGGVVNNWGEGLWPHASRLMSPFQLTAGKQALDYQITAIGSTLNLGTYCHENGHMLCDFPDLYEYADQRLGVGSYCLMCLGGNASPKNPIQIGAYLKYRAGWSNPVTQLAGGMNSTAAAGENQFFVFQRNATEYFIIENRARNGRDLALPDAGLAIWHIDELGSNSEPDKAPPGHQHFECVLMQADGRHDLDQGGNTGDNSDLFRSPLNRRFAANTQPPSAWWDGTPSSLDLHDIGAADSQIPFST